MILSLLLLAIILTACICIVRDQLRRKRAFANGIPTQEAQVSFLGLDLTFAMQNDVERFHTLWTMFLQHDRLFKAYLGPVMFIGVSHPDLMQKVLAHTDCMEKPFFYDFGGYKNGILTADYKLWKSQRKALNPTFNLKILNCFVPIFVSCSREMVKELEKGENGKAINLYDHTSKCTLEMICATTLGMKALERSGKDEFFHNLGLLFELISRRMLSVHHYPDWFYRLTESYRKEKLVRGILRDVVENIIQEKRNECSKTTESTNSAILEGNDHRKPQLFIDQLLSLSDSSRPFTTAEILDNVFTMMVAGYDTSGLTVGHACLLLAIYPDIQEKVYAEVMKHFPTEEALLEVTADSLKRLEYTEMFLKECLRHCPAVPHISRKSLADIELDGITIPAGTILSFSFHALHRRRDLWGPEADRFDPENFSPQRSKDRHPLAYMPFSTGTRNCIGKQYAMISLKVMILYLVRHFKLSTTLRHCDLRFKFMITLKPSIEHLIHIDRR